MSLRNLSILIGAWLGLTCLFGLFVISKVDVGKYQRLASNGVATQGRVTAKQPENHQAVSYLYTVGQRVYSGKGNAGHGNPRFEQLNVGDPVTVYYDPDNPQTSFLGNPADQTGSLSNGIIFMILFGPIILTIGLYVKGWLPPIMTPHK